MAIGTISLKGLFHEDFQYPFMVAAGITEADEGKAVTLDTSAANTVKLAGDADVILGRLEKVENRTVEGVNVGTVSLFGGLEFPVNPNATASSPDETPAVGDYLSGGTTNAAAKGYVQKAAAATKWLVVEVLSSTRVVAIAV